MRSIFGWFTRNPHGDGRAPVEMVALRSVGFGALVTLIAVTSTTKPHPALAGQGLAVLAGLIVLASGAVVAVVISNRSRRDASVRVLVIALAAVAIGADVLAAAQPNGFWAVGPYLIAIIAAGRLGLRGGALMLACALVVPVVGSVVKGNPGAGLSLALGTIPWFLVMRMMWEISCQRDALELSRAAEARAAAAAERGRLAREMHDVLAHSLSALALQLESTRLLARDRGTDDDVVRAIDQAHHLAASGLDDARRAIAAARGDELPGPERIGALAEAFGEQSGLPVAVDVRGEPRQLAPDARLAIYRTTQEALTNVRRHAAAERVDVSLAYLPGEAVLVVEDHAPVGAPAAVPVGMAANAGPAGGSGFGLTGMRERAELLGGKLDARPTGDGFRVELRLPVAE